MIGTTITQFVIGEQRRIPSATGDLTAVINDIVTACKTIAAAMRYGLISDEELFGVAETTNSQGEVQKRLDVIANQLFVQCTEAGGHIAAVVSEEMEDVHPLNDDHRRGRYLLLCDPVDGSFNINENAAFGTIFSILRRPDKGKGQPQSGEFLQPGIEQICAGYAIYGPSCMIVMTTGRGCNGFTLDPLIGEFVLTHPQMNIAASSSRLSANISWLSEWDDPLQRYVTDRLHRSGACEGMESDLRWSRCAVADVHRIMMTGGILLSSANQELRDQGHSGVLRLLYEVNPLAFIVEQAGGLASTGVTRALEVVPQSLHQRSTIILGSRSVVEHALQYF